MKTGLVILSTIVILSVIGCGTEPGMDSNKIELKKNWFIQSSEKVKENAKSICSTGFKTKDWYPVTVPTTVLAALVENGVYPDPYYGDNLKSIPGYQKGRWLAMKKDSPFYPSWWYRTEFKVPDHFEGKKMALHLDGINYKVNVWLNGFQIADTTQIVGMFKRFELPLNSQVKIGAKNVLAIQVFAPGRIPDIEYKTKQIEATTGWDDHNPQPPDLNMGVWRKVYLSATGPVILRHPYVSTDLDLPSLDVAHLTVSTHVSNKSDKIVTGTLTGRIGYTLFKQKVNLQAGETKVVTFTPNEFKQLDFENPKLWWPHPVGPQNLYTLDIDFNINGQVSDETSIRFGIREVSTYINNEGWRGYMVNGDKILIRGGAWMTSDMLLRLTPERYEALVRYAREAHLNMLRSEGFSIRETDEFYDLCDEYGVMVTQQLFGRNLPDEDLAISIIKDMMLRIRNHPSLVHFLGHDETFPTATLDSAYQSLVAQYTPERTYQPHSGAFDIKNRFKTGGTRTGTMELWSFANPEHYYTHKDDGAWGFAQSGGIGGVVAPYESMRKMMPEKDLWPIDNDTFSFHTVLQSLDYFETLRNAMNHKYGEPQDIKDFCLKGQVINYESARGMFEAYARNKYDALGITTWKYDAAWPASITWQYIDWYLNVGGAYYGAKKACEPLHVQYSYDDHSVYVLNSFYKSFGNLTVKAKVFDFDMNVKYSRTATVDVTKDGKTEAFKIDWPQGLSKSYFLSLVLEGNDGQDISNNFYWFSQVPYIEGTKEEVMLEDNWDMFRTIPKSFSDHTDLLKLPPVELKSSYKITDEDNEKVVQVNLKNPSPNLAFMIHLALTRGKDGDEVSPAYWEDNYFSLLPGESKSVTAHIPAYALQGASGHVKIKGWNIK